MPGVRCHHIMCHADGRDTTVPVHPGRDVAKGTLRGILADAGMTVEELQRFCDLLTRDPLVITAWVRRASAADACNLAARLPGRDRETAARRAAAGAGSLSR